jgi:hypothetical protein
LREDEICFFGSAEVHAHAKRESTLVLKNGALTFFRGLVSPLADVLNEVTLGEVNIGDSGDIDH